MAEIVLETGEGVANANSYVTVGMVTAYLFQTGDNVEWKAASQDDKSEACINATAYIDKVFGLRFKGRKEFLDIPRASWSILETLSAASGTRVFINSQDYLWVGSTPSTAYHVFAGNDAADSASNLAAAINDDDPGSGRYGAGTVENPDVEASYSEGDDVYVEAKEAGVDGDEITTISTNTAEAVWANSHLLYGSDGEEQPLEFPRINLYTDSGQLIDGMPLQLLKAASEYAKRAVQDSLLPDPVIDPTGRAVTEQSEKVGPIETTTKWTDNDAIANIIRPYPEADKLLQEYLFPLGRVFRG